MDAIRAQNKRATRGAGERTGTEATMTKGAMWASELNVDDAMLSCAAAPMGTLAAAVLARKGDATIKEEISNRTRRPCR